jgi:hypothetical protein
MTIQYGTLDLEAMRVVPLDLGNEMCAVKFGL